MQLTNPSLILIYTETRTTSTITDEFIVRGSISLSEQLLNGLESSSNTIQLRLHQDCPDIISGTNSILKANNDIKAVLKDGNSVIFTGYISENQSWSVTNNGEQALTINIEDVGTRLLPKAYITSGGKVVLEGLASSIIRTIATRAGITVAADLPVIDTQVCRVVEVGETCQDLLKELCREVGYVYFFTNEGKLNLKKIDCTSTRDLPVLNKDDLQVYGDKALALSKKIRQYKSSKITYTTLADRYEALIYKDISGQDDSHPNCNIELGNNETYPDRENGNVSYVEASDLTEGKEIVYIDNVVPEVEWSRGDGTSSITAFGADTIAVLVKCTYTAGGVVSKLQAKADIKYVDAENIVLAGESALDDESNNVFEAEAKWIHTDSAANTFANLVADFYKYCNKQFTFYSKEQISCGSLVKVTEDVYTGLSVNLLIYGRTLTDENNVIKYSAYSISEFDLTKPTQNTRTYTPPSTVNIVSGGESYFFDLNLSSGIYRRNSRKTDKQLITVSISIQGYSETSATVTTNHGSFNRDSESHSITVVAGTPVTLYIPYDNDYDSITLSAVLNAETEVIKVISAVNETANWVYLGALSVLPSASTYGYDKFASGDHFLCISDIGTDHKAGNCYAWTGVEWAEADPSLTDIDGNVLGEDFYATAITNCINDAVDTNFNEGTQLGSWIKRLAANEIITDTIMAKELIMRSTGILRSAQYLESEGFPTSGYKLTSSDGTLKAMNAYLRDVNIKCTDSTNAILLQTQRYQQGTSGIAVRNTRQSARWCIDDLASTLSANSQTNCTYAGNTRSVFKPNTTLYTNGYRYLITSAHITSGGRTKDGYQNGESVYTFPVSGYYYIFVQNRANTTYPFVLTSYGTYYGRNNSDLMCDFGYASAGTQVLIGEANSYTVYLYNTDWDIEISEKVSTTFNYNGGGWAGIDWHWAANFSGINYMPEVWVQPGSVLSQALTTNTFDSEQNRNMYALSNTIAAWPEGLYNCDSGSTITEGSTTLTAVNIGVSSNAVTFTDASYNSIRVSLPVSTSSVATTGWAKNLSGSINLIGQVSAILTMNILPSQNNKATLGTAGQAWANVVSYGYNSLSSREEKKDIIPYTDNATDIINDTQVVSFHYKNDKDNLPKIGFIAEDTDPLMSTPKQDKFDLNNTVGLLLKAVQELSARLDKLESK